jgi:hypothetical protein
LFALACQYHFTTAVYSRLLRESITVKKLQNEALLNHHAESRRRDTIRALPVSEATRAPSSVEKLHFPSRILSRASSNDSGNMEFSKRKETKDLGKTVATNANTTSPAGE